jgi:hypothetical protein
MLDIPAESGEVFDASFGSAYATNPTSSITRMQALEDEEVGAPQVGAGLGRLPSQRLAPDTPLLDAQAARDKVSGMGLDIKIPDQGIREGALDILVDRHREQAARQQVMARANGGSMGTQIAAGLAASLLDPLNIASAFVPVVGEARYSAILARASSPLGRAGVRAGVGAVEGVVGAAIIEPLPLLAAGMDQTEYGLSDSLANIAMGGVLGGGLHTIGGAVSDALRRNLAADTPEARLNQGEVLATDQPGTSQTLRTGVFDRLFEHDPEAALKATLAKHLQDDSDTLYSSAQRQAIEEIRPTLTGERIGNVADLRVERVGLTQQAMELDDTFKGLAKQFQGQGMSRKQAERAARDTIAVQREQIGARQSEINAQLERNQTGEFDRRDLGLIERGQIPERLRPQIEARAKQIMAGYELRPLGPAVRTARETAEAADWTVRDSALRSAVAQAVSGRDIDVNALFDLETPSKSAGAIEYAKRPLSRRVDPQGQTESVRVDTEPKTNGRDDFDSTKQAYEEESALVKEMLDQMPEGDRAAVLAYSREESQAAQAGADRSEQYSKAYRAAAVCDIRTGQ